MTQVVTTLTSGTQRLHLRMTRLKTLGFDCLIQREVTRVTEGLRLPPLPVERSMDSLFMCLE